MSNENIFLNIEELKENNLNLFLAEYSNNEKQKYEIKDEIQVLQNKIVELEKLQKQKEMEEENAKKITFEYYFEKLFDLIKIKKNRDQEYLPRFFTTQQSVVAKFAKQQNAEFVPALENIHSALDIINKRLNKLENL